MIPQSFIQDLLARVDIVSVVEPYVALKKAGANYFACCPFHSEKSASFSVSPTKQFYHCFGCGAHGTAISFLMEYQGLGYVDAIKELASRVGMTVPDDRGAGGAASAEPVVSPLLSVLSKAAQFYREQLKNNSRAIDYLKKRGLTGEIAVRFGIGYAPDGWQSLHSVFPDYTAQPTLIDAGLVIKHDEGRLYDRFRDRIMFPILNGRGQIIAFGGRILESGEPKYLNSPESPVFEKGRELYGLFQARQAIRRAGCVIVVEGYMDVVALAQYGIEHAVATLGTATTAAHIQTLFRHTDRVVFCFDGDAPGQKAAWRAMSGSLESLADNKQIAFLLLPTEHDPDSFVRSQGTAAFTAQVENAQPLAEFLISGLKLEASLASADGRARFAHESRTYIERVAAPLLRLQLLKAVSEVAGFTQTELEIAWKLKPALPLPRPEPAQKFAPLPRKRPSTVIGALLRLVAHHPVLATRIPITLLPTDTPEARALAALVDAIDIGELSGQIGLATVMEYFRGSPHQPVLAEQVRQSLDEEFEGHVTEQVFQDALNRLRWSHVDQEFQTMHRKASQQGLSAEEQSRYRDLIQQRAELSRRTPVSDS
ncbi:MAG: DNA primase [Zoogloeaceae bacterium]|nr:DNA primase [Zoogloeaceae bacterium]